MKMTIEGKEYEFVRVGQPREGETFIAITGNVEKADASWDTRIYPKGERTIILPVPVIEWFGGLAFEDTGEVCHVKRNEWFMFVTGSFKEFRCYSGLTQSKGNFKIYRPVQEVSAHD